MNPANAAPAALAEQFVSRLVTRCPVDVNSKPTRRPNIFDSAYVFDQAFIAHVEMIMKDRRPPPLKHSRTLQDEELEAIQKALETPGTAIHAPAGIPGFDLIAVRGSRLVNLARPVARLSHVSFSYHPPSPRAETPDGILYAPGFYTQDIQFTLRKLQISRYEWTKLLKAYQLAEGLTPRIPVTENSEPRTHHP